ncbi:hypothetical protein HYC85_014565 [Camellia sinensis]|uniref:Uncharacterized protein n=1 Tax=Camellia sinensis TaxID=4442 RepID=A0A7J7H9Y6_CAMSI|nr:hypothetical protein HYC85_014565 [Camellia sinensis]
MMAALYLQVSIVSQALIFVTRSRSWSFAERPGLLLLFGFVAAQLFCKDRRMWLGLGRCHLALQCGNIYSASLTQICDPLRFKWESLGYPFGKQVFLWFFDSLVLVLTFFFSCKDCFYYKD